MFYLNPIGQTTYCKYNNITKITFLLEMQGCKI